MSLTLAMRMLNREIEVNTLNIYGQVVWYQSATLELRDIVREWVATHCLVLWIVGFET